MIRLAIVGLGLLSIATPAQADAPVTADNCKPQPDCRILYSPYRPGAPTGGLNDRGAIVIQGNSAEPVASVPNKNNNSSTDDARKSFRIPSDTVDMERAR